MMVMVLAVVVAFVVVVIPEKRKAANQMFMYWSIPRRGLANCTENTCAMHSSDHNTRA